MFSCEQKIRVIVHPPVQKLSLVLQLLYQNLPAMLLHRSYCLSKRLLVSLDDHSQCDEVSKHKNSLVFLKIFNVQN